MRIATAIAIALAANLTVLPVANGQEQCGVMQISNRFDTSFNFNYTGIRRFSMPLSNCTGMAYGAVTACAPTSQAFSASVFNAFLQSPASPITGAGDYCLFTCAGPDGGCTFQVNFVDGLPVELLEFNIDEIEREDDQEK